jgi:hypothetical protein
VTGVVAREEEPVVRSRVVGSALEISLVAFALIGAPACGGKLLLLPTSGDGGDDSSGPGGSGGGGDPFSSSSSSSSGSASSSGSSGGAAYYSSSSSSGETYGSSGGGSSSGPPANPCLGSADCAAGLVCCATIDLSTQCQAGPCPETTFGRIQLCATATECLVQGDTCIPLTIAPETPITVCIPPDGGRP